MEMKNADETFATKRENEDNDIEQLVDVCDDLMEKLRFLKLKKQLVNEFIKLQNSKTDLQKALQLENIKKYLKHKTSMLIQENYRYKETISSAKIM